MTEHEKYVLSVAIKQHRSLKDGKNLSFIARLDNGNVLLKDSMAESPAGDRWYWVLNMKMRRLDYKRNQGLRYA